MTREEQRAVRELKHAVGKAVRSTCKAHSYKTINGWCYKVLNEFLYIVSVDVYPISCGKYISSNLYVKPLAIDTAFWDVFEMADIAQKQPFSFHVSAAYVPYSLQLEKLQVDVSSSADAETALEQLLDLSDEVIDCSSQRFRTIADFKSEICQKTDPISRLNTALCAVAEGNYHEALAIAQEELSTGQLGLFVRMDDNGTHDIYAYLKQYCQDHLNHQIT